MRSSFIWDLFKYFLCLCHGERTIFSFFLGHTLLYTVFFGVRACLLDDFIQMTSCHLQAISVVSNCAMAYLNTNELVTSKVATTQKPQKILQLKDIYNLEVSKFMYKHTNSQLTDTFNNYFKLITELIHVIQDKSKPDNLL